MTVHTARDLVIARPVWGRLGVLVPLWLVLAAVALGALWIDSALALPVLVPLAAATVLVVAAAHPAVGSTIELTSQGVLVTGHVRQRQPVLLPWSEVAAMWVARDRVFVSPRVGPLRNGGLWPDTVDPMRLRQMVAEASGGRITMGSGRPAPAANPVLALPAGPRPGTALPDGPAYPIMRRRRLRPPTSLLAPVPFLLLVAVALVPVAWSLRLVSATIVAVLALGAAVVLVRLVATSRVTIDDAGLVARGELMPWLMITGLERRRTGPWHRLLIHRGGLALPPLTVLATWPPASMTSFERRSDLVYAAWRSRGGQGDLARTTTPFWRAGLPAVLVLLLLPAVTLVSADRPWQRAWWPGVELALTTPEPCTAIDPQTRAPLVTDAQPADRRGGPTDFDRACTFVREGALLVVEYRRFTAVGAKSGEQRAAERYASEAIRYVEHPDGLGDEASASITSGANLSVEILVRRANMLVQLSYTGPESIGADAHVTVAAQDAVRAIRLQ